MFSFSLQVFTENVLTNFNFATKLANYTIINSGNSLHITDIEKKTQINRKLQQPFYGPLIQDNPGEPIPETIGHINPRYHHYPPQYL